MTDYVGFSNLSPGVNLSSGGSVGFGKNRFNQTNSSIYLNNGYYSIPPGIYFNDGDFTILAWINVVNFARSSRLVEFSNGQYNNNIIFAFTDGSSGMPAVQLYRGNSRQNFLDSSLALTQNNWYHVGTVLSGTNLYVYVNGVLQGSLSNSLIPLNVMRSSCSIGRSSWYPQDSDANAYVDQLKIYNRALSQNEIQFDMSLSD